MVNFREEYTSSKFSFDEKKKEAKKVLSIPLHVIRGD
jgi:hypothetical protein